MLASELTIFSPAVQVNRVKRVAVDPNRWLKAGVWVYFWLLIFEGALRKWFLPGLATPLLLIRDPIGIWILFESFKSKILPLNWYVVVVVTISTLGVFTSVLFGHGNLIVALYGARIFIIYFPLMFVIGRIFTHKDVLNIGTAMLWTTIPMTLLVAMQFYSPQSAWVNRGVGGDISGAGFSGSGIYFRPPATFSFISGTVLFYGLVACYIVYFWLNSNKVNRLLLGIATICLLVAIPFSISRSLFFQVCITIVFACIAVSRRPRYIGRLILSLFIVFIILSILSQTDFFQISTGAFTDRFESATENEGGLSGTLGNRFLGGMLSAIENSTDLPFFGLGLGMGTNVGSQLLTGSLSFLVAEGEWGRVIGEFGLLMGLLLITIRVSLVFKISLASYRALQTGNILPWMILSSGLLTIIQGQWSQPTTLGFSTLVGGLIIASFRKLN